MPLRRWIPVLVVGAIACESSPSYVIVHQPVYTVRVTPANDTIPFGGSVSLRVSTFDLSGNPTTPDHPPVWASLNSAVLTVDTIGNVAAIWYGEGTIRVIVDGVEGDAQIVALPPAVAKLSVLGPNARPERGDTVQFQVRATNEVQLPVPTTGAQWSVSDSTRMRIDSNGRAVAVGAGPVTVRATFAGLSDSTLETVLVPAASVTLSPRTLSLAFGATDSFQVTVRDSAGNVLTDHPVAVFAPAVVRAAPLVDPPAAYVAVRGFTEGAGTVVVTSGRARDSVTVSVGAPHYLTFTSAVAGGAFTCAVTVDSAAYCWGWGHAGELGTGDTASGPQPRAVVGGLKFTGVTAGPEFACGLTPAGAAYCWGNNATLQLGIPGGSTPTPTPVSGGNQYTALDAHFSIFGDSSSGGVCGLAVGGQVYCWGSGWGATPVPVGTPGFVDRLALGALGYCGVRSVDTAAFCWSPSSAPARLAGWDSLPLALESRGSWALTCGISRFKAYCGGAWPDSTAHWRPMTLSRSNQVPIVGSTLEVAAGVSHECVYAPVAILCRGDNRRGQLGATTGAGFVDSFVFLDAPPVSLTGLEAGWSHTCVFGGDGLLYCWGENSFGQAGSTGSDVLGPQPVLGQPPSGN